MRVVAGIREAGVRARRLSRLEWWLLARALGTVAAMRVGLTAVGFLRLRRAIAALLAPRSSALAVPPEMICRSVSRAARIVPGASCLTQAMAAQVLLAAAGYEARLQLGARHATRGIEAHAWLESGGTVIFGEPADFTPLPPIESLL